MKDNRCKKLAILSFHYLSYKGGPTTYVYNLFKELKKDFDVYILTWDNYRDKRVINLKGKRFLLFVSTLISLVRLQPEIIHVHECEFMLLSALLYKKLFKLNTRIIYTFHTRPIRDTSQEHPKKRGIIKRTVHSWALSKCDFITSVSQSLADDLRSVDNLTIEKEILIIPPGAHFKKYEQNEILSFRERFNLDETFTIICMIAVFEWYYKVKGIEILIKATKRISATYPSVKLVIVGDGKYRNYLENVVTQLSLTKSVIFTGYWDNVFVPLSASDIYCHISLQEGLPIAIIEAMACAKPIVAAKIGGIPEVILDRCTGLLVDPNEDEIAKAIIYILKNPDVRKKIARNAISVARSKYAWDKIADQYRKLYLDPTGSN